MSVASRASAETELALAAGGATAATHGETQHKVADPTKIRIVFMAEIPGWSNLWRSPAYAFALGTRIYSRRDLAGTAGDGWLEASKSDARATPPTFVPERQNLDRCLALVDTVVDDAPHARDEHATDTRKTRTPSKRTDPRLRGEQRDDPSQLLADRVGSGGTIAPPPSCGFPCLSKSPFREDYAVGED